MVMHPTFHMGARYFAQNAIGDRQWGWGVQDKIFLFESQNGPAVTARCSDHKWTSHNQISPAHQSPNKNQNDSSATEASDEVSKYLHLAEEAQNNSDNQKRKYLTRNICFCGRISCCFVDDRIAKIATLSRTTHVLHRDETTRKNWYAERDFQEVNGSNLDCRGSSVAKERNRITGLLALAGN